MFSLSSENLSRKARLSYLGLALFVALAFDFLFWDVQVLGLGFFLFVSLYILGFTLIAFLSKQLHQLKALWLLLPIFIFSLDILSLNNDFVKSLVPLLVAILLLVYPFLLTLRNPEKLKFDLFKLSLLGNFSKGINKLQQIFSDLGSSSKVKNSELYKKILIGVLISVPILFIFLALFLSADPVFAKKVHSLFNFQVEPDLVFRIFRTLFLTLILGSFFYILVDNSHKLEYSKKLVLKIDKAVAIVVLSLVNFLFATFVIIQLQYLFGSTNFVLEQGLVFADYARQGFFQLVWVIIFSAILLVIFYRSASEHGSHIALKLLKIFLILQVAVIVMSALKRMNLYQEAYGFTTMRLYVEWFIYFCIAILTFTAVSLSIDFEFRRFFNIIVGLGIVALCVVSSINVDRMIARRNIDRFVNENKSIDLYYLVRLSSDAIEEINRLNFTMETDGVSNSSNLYYYSDNDYFDINTNPAKYIKNSWKERHENKTWKEFNFSVNKLWKTNN
ncbi:MAG: hypothetical protein A2493_03065 [Candidatus Magasanikbacteria bacterium RIFOXYC12_FULL_33_11]|uniref:Uncharacterized protein n=1 Tax=Candidatus Magasanikbacteria bacterium RIFOXYC12_FULL_33_11 TaxID=1798701 RepID=A0A1F6NMG1_9BACT|nr:MAG: hypothetical protein A2493_03065 [Candidatus Magasanikbacteria bacterium RIFOXYC12_FULL_33_11]